MDDANRDPIARSPGGPYVFTTVEDLFDFYPVFDSPEQARAYLAEFERLAAEREAMALDEDDLARRCHDCEALEGQLHALGCDMERCPSCTGQLISCGCVYRWLGARGRRKPKSEQQRVVLAHLDRLGRVPHVRFPSLCARCGSREPAVWRHTAGSEAWDRYVQPDQRQSWLCQACWERIKAVTDLRSATRSR